MTSISERTYKNEKLNIHLALLRVEQRQPIFTTNLTFIAVFWSTMAAYHEKYNEHIEHIRAAEYPSLLSTTYLDHAGTTLYARSLLDAHHEDLACHLYGNPHSESPASWLATQKVDASRQAVLDYLRADADHFDVVFCANATAAIKLVADCFREQSFQFCYHKDSHSSVVGVRELAESSSCFTTDDDVEVYTKRRPSGIRLFAFPAQSNLSGSRLPYEWTKRLRAGGNYVLLDAASYLTTGRLDLSDVEAAPDFVALSFYKIFGYPDLGALIVQKTASSVLRARRYFGGGTIDVLTVLGGSAHVKKASIHEFLEDGTLPFHNILAIPHAIRIHQQIFGTARDIAQHTAHLAKWLYEHLLRLRHGNNQPVLEIHKDKGATYGDPTTQGPILAFSMLNPDGSYLGKSHFERLAIKCGFQLRTGGVCNPGGVQSSFDLEHWHMMRNYAKGATCGAAIDVLGGKPTRIVRVSLGPMSTMSDVRRLFRFVKTFFVKEKMMASTVISRPMSIMPVEGCIPLEVEHIVEYEPFHHIWCVVAHDNRVLTSKVAELEVEIDTQREELVLNETFKMSLWEVPTSSPDAPPSAREHRYFDRYDGDINEFLTTTLGIECALARYRGGDLRYSPAATTCVVCLARFSDTDILTEHYGEHAQVFLATHPLNESKTGKHEKKLFTLNRSMLDASSLVTAPQAKPAGKQSQVKIQNFEVQAYDKKAKVKSHNSTSLKIRTIVMGKR